MEPFGQGNSKIRGLVSIDLFLSRISSVNRRGRFREQCYSIDSFRAGEKEEFIIVERDNIFHFGFLLFT